MECAKRSTSKQSNRKKKQNVRKPIAKRNSTRPRSKVENLAWANRTGRWESAAARAIFTSAHGELHAQRETRERERERATSHVWTNRDNSSVLAGVLRRIIVGNERSRMSAISTPPERILQTKPAKPQSGEMRVLCTEGLF